MKSLSTLSVFLIRLSRTATAPAGSGAPSTSWKCPRLWNIAAPDGMIDWSNDISGHPASPHYTDPQAKWADNHFVPMLFSWDRVEAEAKIKQLLRPDSTR